MRFSYVSRGPICEFLFLLQSFSFVWSQNAPTRSILHWNIDKWKVELGVRNRVGSEPAQNSRCCLFLPMLPVFGTHRLRFWLSPPGNQVSCTCFCILPSVSTWKQYRHSALKSWLMSCCGCQRYNIGRWQCYETEEKRKQHHTLVRSHTVFHGNRSLISRNLQLFLCDKHVVGFAGLCILTQLPSSHEVHTPLWNKSFHGRQATSRGFRADIVDIAAKLKLRVSHEFVTWVHAFGLAGNNFDSCLSIRQTMDPTCDSYVWSKYVKVMYCLQLKFKAILYPRIEFWAIRTLLYNLYLGNERFVYILTNLLLSFQLKPI